MKVYSTSLALPFFPGCRLQPAAHFGELQNLIYLVLVLLSSPSFVLFISAVIILSIVISLFVVQLAVELSEDVSNSFSEMSPFLLFRISVFFLADLIYDLCS